MHNLPRGESDQAWHDRYMGYETVLSLGDETVFMWRKYADSLPRLLFRHDQFHVEEINDGHSPSSVAASVRVELRTTAREALETLDAAGLGWPATVAAHSETMVRRGIAAGMVLARSMSLGHDDENSTATPEWDALDEFDRVGAETDLMQLGALLAHQLFNKPGDKDDSYSQDHTILGQITLDGRIESVWMTMHAARTYVEKWALGVDVFPLMRAVESWCVLNRDAPLIAWPVLMAVLLYSVDPDSPLVLELTDDAWDTEGVNSVDDGLSYVQAYWQGSGESMASSARVIGKLFGVLSSFDGELSREFWFARAAESLEKILSPINGSTKAMTTKSRGDLLEDLVEALVRTEMPDLDIVERNFRTRGEEIDLIVSNGLSHPFWIAHQSPLIIFECKNTSTKIGVPELRILESKISDRNAVCRIGVFVSMSGFTRPFYSRLRSAQASSGIIFAITGQELADVVGRKQRLTEWLRTQGIAAALGSRSY